MLVGVKFCGGCNPRYERGKALNTIKERMQGEADFIIAEEGGEYDYLLVIGGCTNCCASTGQYKARKDTIRMWDESHIENTIQVLLNDGISP
ncbi:MAG TPA: hypothetical protein VN381_11950 [Anaerovoracaceae bacterium]|nr:hypothetical protein [Anaerovoracaceae bacterium]